MAGNQDPSNTPPGTGDPNVGGDPPPTLPPVQDPPIPPEPPSGDPPPADQQQQQQEPARTDWRDRRIGELTARNREQRAELERLRAQAGSQSDPARAPNGQ